MIAPGPPLFPMDKLYRLMGYAGVCTISRSAREGAAHTSSRDKDGGNSSRGETIVREREEGERKTGSACAFAPAAAAVEVEEEEEKTRNTLACPKRKEKTKFGGEEREEDGPNGAGGTKQPAGWFEEKRRETRVERRRGVEKDGKRARVRSGRN